MDINREEKRRKSIRENVLYQNLEKWFTMEVFVQKKNGTVCWEYGVSELFIYGQENSWVKMGFGCASESKWVSQGWEGHDLAEDETQELGKPGDSVS